MKILFVSDAVGDGGGAEKFCLQQMLLARSSGHEVRILSSDPYKKNDVQYEIDQSLLRTSSSYKNIGFFKKISLISSVFFNRQVYKKMVLAIEDFSPDIIHLHRVKSLSSAVYFSMKKSHAKVVMTLHDHYLTCPSSSRVYGNGLPCRLDKCSVSVAVSKKCVRDSYAATFISLAEWFFRRLVVKDIEIVDKYLVPSQFLLNWTGRSGVPLRKLVQHRNFSAVNNVGKVEKLDYFVYVGRLTEEKGVHVLLEAAKMLPFVKIKLIGTGPSEAVFGEVIKANRLTNVELTGQKTGKELDDLVARAAALILPSVCFENAPLAIIEAFRLGTAVIGSDKGGISEMIQNGSNGFLFQAGDAFELSEKIMKFNNDHFLKYKLGAVAKTGSDLFSEKSHLAGLNTIYGKN